ncbi:MAG: ABC transporter ATP-binding protein [Limnochordia bacterium]|jgi:branched-chain amino acid transport system ATP-binding protein|nr:ABC transporter ATP-binding protein [Limnochordia bacterium]
MLKITKLSVSYGDIPALKKVNLEVKQGDVVSVLGANGAGKTTLLKTISGLLKGDAESRIEFLGEPIHNLPPHEIVKRGLVHLPEGRQVFPELTVMENIEVGSFTRQDRRQVKEDIAKCFEMFPELRGKEKQLAGTLSGGEQQMVATARALIAAPKLLMIDEPSMGLAPVVVKRIFGLLREFIARGITILLVEQNAYMSMAVSNYAYILAQGEIVLHGSVEELRQDESVKDSYLGKKTTK